MKRRTIFFAFGVMLAMATVSSAANKEETFSVSPMFGGITFEGKQHLESNVVYGVRLGYNFTKELGVEALFDYAHTEPTLSSGKVDFYRYGGELLYHFFPDNTFVPYVAAGYAASSFNGSVPLSGGSNYTKGTFDYGIGAKYFLTDAIALRGDVRHLVYRFDDTQQAVEYMVGLYIPFGGVKPVAKAVEPAPAPTPAPAPAAEPIVAPAPPPVAPPPPATPSANVTITPTSITKGETANLNWTSQNASKCEIQPAIGSVQPQGTVSVTPADNSSYILTCEGIGGVATSTATIAVIPPPVVKVAKLCSPAVVNIQFDTNKSDIKPQYYNELKKLGDFLTEFPNAKGVVEGHTDNVGNNASNMKLSQRRADSVRNYIVKTFGIAPERIKAQGYGPTKPLASNKTKEGKAQNRRIEVNFSCE